MLVKKLWLLWSNATGTQVRKKWDETINSRANSIYYLSISHSLTNKLLMLSSLLTLSSRIDSHQNDLFSSWPFKFFIGAFITVIINSIHLVLGSSFYFLQLFPAFSRELDIHIISSKYNCLSLVICEWNSGLIYDSFFKLLSPHPQQSCQFKASSLFLSYFFKAQFSQPSSTFWSREYLL